MEFKEILEPAGPPGGPACLAGVAPGKAEPLAFPASVPTADFRERADGAGYPGLAPSSGRAGRVAFLDGAGNRHGPDYPASVPTVAYLEFQDGVAGQGTADNLDGPACQDGLEPEKVVRLDEAGGLVLLALVLQAEPLAGLEYQARAARAAGLEHQDGAGRENQDSLAGAVPVIAEPQDNLDSALKVGPLDGVESQDIALSTAGLDSPGGVGPGAPRPATEPISRCSCSWRSFRDYR